MKVTNAECKIAFQYDTDTTLTCQKPKSSISCKENMGNLPFDPISPACPRSTAFFGDFRCRPVFLLKNHPNSAANRPSPWLRLLLLGQFPLPAPDQGQRFERGGEVNPALGVSELCQ